MTARCGARFHGFGMMEDELGSRQWAFLFITHADAGTCWVYCMHTAAGNVLQRAFCRILFDVKKIPGFCPQLMPTTNISSERASRVGSDSCVVLSGSNPITRERGVNEFN